MQLHALELLWLIYSEIINMVSDGCIETSFGGPLTNSSCSGMNQNQYPYLIFFLCTSYLFSLVWPHFVCANHHYSIVYVHITFILFWFCTPTLVYCVCAYHIYCIVYVQIKFILLCLCLFCVLCINWCVSAHHILLIQYCYCFVMILS